MAKGLDVPGSEGRYRALVEHAHDAILILDPTAKVVEVNAETERLLGRPRAEIVGRHYDEFVVPDERADSARRQAQLLTEGTVRVEERQLVRADGDPRWVEVSASLVRLGEESAVLAILHDVTERRRGDEALRRSEARMKSVLDAALDAVIMMDEKGLVVSWNARAEELFGWARDEAVGRTLSELIIPPRYRAAHTRGLKAFLATGEGPVIGRRTELSALRRDGSEFAIELTVTTFKEGQVSYFNAFVADITERKRAEEEHRASAEQYRLLFDHNPYPMWVFDVESLAFLAVNDAAVRHYGWTREEFLGLRLTDVRSEETIPALLKHVEDVRNEPGQHDQPGVWRHRKKDGTEIDVEIAATSITFEGRRARLTLAADMTEKTELEAQLVRAQKMEAVGQLAGGIAHDFNNLLGVITGNTELLMRDLPTQSRARARGEEIKRASDRAAALTRQLLAFSRRQVLQPKVLDLDEVVAEVEKMMRRVISADIQIVTVATAKLGKVRADAGQIEQVLMNLAINARDAMPSGGRLMIETANVELDEAFVRTNPDAHPGPHVMLAVSDSGHGMDVKTMSRIFEPFFTTKAEGKGTGLGLASVYGIVRQSGGIVNVSSEPGHGTMFKIYLPRVDAEVATAAPAELAAPPGGTETILLVEDAEALRMLVRELLEGVGYTVLEADSPDKALSLVQSTTGSIHLVLTDMVMPRMNGRELARQIGILKPEAGVIFMSGYSDQAMADQGTLEPGALFLQKPFSMEALMRTVRQALDTGPPPARSPES